ncbi:MAG: hypothetical protein M1820_001035 [Bogoriella megaspora]|nr:MAG: hypothetical protein M1820_001035 [Bogoriella megaspora]
MGLTVGWVFNLDHEVPTSAPELIAIAVVFPCIALCAVALRYFLRLREKASLSLGLDDYTIVVAWTPDKDYPVPQQSSSMCTHEIKRLILLPITETRWGQGLDLAYFPPENTIAFGKVQYASGPVYPLSLLAFKFSILALYLRIGGQVQSHRNVIFTLMVVVTVTQLIYTFLFCFGCTPPSKTWDTTVPGHCINEVAMYYSLAATSMFFDIVILVVPMPVLLRLQMSFRKRVRPPPYIGLCLILALGLFITIIQIIRIFRIADLKSYTNSAAIIEWSIVEVNLGVVVACIPTYGPIFKNLFHRINSSINNLSGHKSQNKYGYPSSKKSIRLGSWNGDRNNKGKDLNGSTLASAERAQSSDSQEAIVQPIDGVLKTRTYAVEIESASESREGRNPNFRHD